jgi:hypothetical protein
VYYALGKKKITITDYLRKPIYKKECSFWKLIILKTDTCNLESSANKSTPASGFFSCLFKDIAGIETG